MPDTTVETTHSNWKGVLSMQFLNEACLPFIIFKFEESICSTAHLLCILTRFWVLQAHECWSRYFSWPFSTILLIFNVFQRVAQNTVSQAFCRHFLLISDEKSLTNDKNEKERLKTAQKIMSTSFGVQAAPESWSKYTTSFVSISITHKHVSGIQLKLFSAIHNFSHCGNAETLSW